MATWLRLICVVFLAAFATGTFGQSAQATVMELQTTMSSPSGMGSAPSCDHCKMGADHHLLSCDAFCVSQAAVILSPFIATFRASTVSRMEIESLWGFDGPARSPAPPPPRISILS